MSEFPSPICLAHLKDQLALFAQASEQSPVSLIITDLEMNILYVNNRYCNQTGYSPDEIVGKKASVLKSGLTAPKTYLELRSTLTEGRTWQGEFHNRKKNGTLYWESALITPLKSLAGDTTHYLGLLEDLGTRHRTLQVFTYLSNHDQLTDLPNQSYFIEFLERTLAAAKTSGSLLAVILLDLDRFKIVTETLGHKVGDGILSAVAERLSTALPDNALTARRGGDEFLILLTSVDEFQSVVKLAKQIIVLFTAPFVHGEHSVHLTASLGISLFPDDGNTPQILLQSADAALYDAKDAGRNNFKFHKIKQTSESFERLSLENDLRQAVVRGEMRVFYPFPSSPLSRKGPFGLQ